MGRYTEDEIRAVGLNPALPKHIGIIMDGNGRWAERRDMKRGAGHRAGTESLREIIRTSSDLGIGALSLYAFSTENWKRPLAEVTALFGLLVEYFTQEIDELDENKVCIRILGDVGAMPMAVRAAVSAAQARTKNNGGLKLCIALNYGSRAEILMAVKSLMADARDGKMEPESLDEGMFADRLYTAGLPELDMVIRTAGEKRLSNFMMYQAAYAEFIFTDVLWPDFTRDDLIAAIREYQHRARRYGGV